MCHKGVSWASKGCYKGVSMERHVEVPHKEEEEEDFIFANNLQIMGSQLINKYLQKFLESINTQMKNYRGR